jgi:Kef-type K+ transport system membrane component KefB
MEGSLTFSLFIIFSGAAIMASLSLYARQPLLIAYICVGALAGPFALGWVSDTALLSDIAHIGILFLLFLLGLDMQPQALLAVIRKASLVTLLSSTLFAVTGFCVGYYSGYTVTESLIIGAAMMFSSTIIGIKLLPTTVLHHRRVGELMVGILLIQDMLAIFVLIALTSGQSGQFELMHFVAVVIALPALIAGAFTLVHWILLPLIRRFDRFQEYIFLLAIGWCLGMAEASHALGLSSEIGAFIAGISIATSPIAQFIATSLRPLRDFFLIMFFFSVGASFDFAMLGSIWQPALILAVLMLAGKPVVFRFLLRGLSEKSTLAWDVGFRLGQISEFSLLIAYVAVTQGLLGKEASHVIQAAAILTFLASSYIVVLNYPSPIAVSDKLRRD